MVTREYAISTVKEFIKACSNSNIFFNKIIVFGSVAVGTTHSGSDIDVALISDLFTGQPFTDWHLLSPINIRFPDIEPHPFSTQYFKASDPFIDEIVRTGFEIKLD